MLRSTFIPILPRNLTLFRTRSSLPVDIVSNVAGQAGILLAPDLEAANMKAKQLIYLAGADAAGIVLGAQVPIILTRRADSPMPRLASCALAQLTIHHERQSAP